MAKNSVTLAANAAGNRKRSAFLKSLASTADDAQEQPGVQADVYLRYLGIKASAAGSANIVERVRSGLPMSAGKKLADQLGLEPKVLFMQYLGMSRSTVMRREKQPASRFTPLESDKLVRYARLLGQVAGLMEGDVGLARDWLESPSEALAGQTPLACATTEIGARRVEDLVTSLEYGMFN